MLRPSLAGTGTLPPRLEPLRPADLIQGLSTLHQSYTDFSKISSGNIMPPRSTKPDWNIISCSKQKKRSKHHKIKSQKPQGFPSGEEVQTVGIGRLQNHIFFSLLAPRSVQCSIWRLGRTCNLGSVILLPLCGVVGGSESNGGATLLLNHEIANNLSSQEQLSFSGRSIHCWPSMHSSSRYTMQDTEDAIMLIW